MKCGNCLHGQFLMTAHKKPRPRPGICGTCTAPLPKIDAEAYPLAVRLVFGFTDQVRGMTNFPSRTWPEQIATECTRWEPKTETPDETDA